MANTAYTANVIVLGAVASEDSYKEGSDDSQAEGYNCSGHGCDRADCCKGYGHAIKDRYSRSREGQIPSEDYALLRHPNNRWRL